VARRGAELATTAAAKLRAEREQGGGCRARIHACMDALGEWMVEILTACFSSQLELSEFFER
jgi:hypothetical protein